MRIFCIRVLLCAAVAQAACGGGGGEKTADTNRPAAATTLAHGPSANAPTAPTTAPPATSTTVPPVASSHGGGAPAAPPAGQARAGVDTSALDAKIALALAKAKAPRATAADRKAAAVAYLERGNFYRDAGNPMLYRFALADFKSVLLYDPSNAEAAAKRDEIIRIYGTMGRPVPEVSNEK